MFGRLRRKPLTEVDIVDIQVANEAVRARKAHEARLLTMSPRERIEQALAKAGVPFTIEALLGRPYIFSCDYEGWNVYVGQIVGIELQSWETLQLHSSTPFMQSRDTTMYFQKDAWSIWNRDLRGFVKGQLKVL